MNNTNGIIAEQSKKKIAEAMLKVMNTYDYKEITVTQITQEARISRKTFYRHFRDKDLLAYSIGGMNSMLIKWIEGGMSISSSTLILCLREGLSSEM